MPELTLSFTSLDSNAVNTIIDTIRCVPGVDKIKNSYSNVKLEQKLYKSVTSELIVRFGDKAVERIGAALMALFGLPGAPLGTITFGTPHGPASFTYDPRRHTLEEVVTQMKRLTNQPNVSEH